MEWLVEYRFNQCGKNVSGEDTPIDSSQYDVWVGPIIKQGNKYVLNKDSDGNLFFHLKMIHMMNKGSFN